MFFVFRWREDDLNSWLERKVSFIVSDQSASGWTKTEEVNVRTVGFWSLLHASPPTTFFPFLLYPPPLRATQVRPKSRPSNTHARCIPTRNRCVERYTKRLFPSHEDILFFFSNHRRKEEEQKNSFSLIENNIIPSFFNWRCASHNGPLKIIEMDVNHIFTAIAVNLIFSFFFFFLSRKVARRNFNNKNKKKEFTISPLFS